MHIGIVLYCALFLPPIILFEFYEFDQDPVLSGPSLSVRQTKILNLVENKA
jgi:hypothetical protein